MRMVLAAGGEEWELEVVVQDGATVAQLAAAVGACRVRSGDHDLPPAQPLVEAGITEGVVLHVDDQRPAPPHALELAVVGGLDAGRSVPLPPGRHVIGRDGGVRIEDPAVSRAHLAVDVGAGASVEDLGSANGTLVGDHLLRAPAPLAIGERIRAGTSLLELRRPHAADRAATSPGGAGHLVLNRPPRRSVPGVP